MGTTTGATEVFVLTTNAVGQADIEIDALRNRVTSGVPEGANCQVIKQAKEPP